MWSDVGPEAITDNGATGTVVHIIYQDKLAPDLHIAVIVKFDSYRGPAFVENQPMYVTICPISVKSQTEGSYHERQQLPLRLCLGFNHT